jgi:hypothetical protein
VARVKVYVEKYISLSILEKGQRLDGRSLTDIRPLTVEVALLPRTHGTGMFMRGDTQVLSIVTLGAPGDVQTLDTMEEEGTKRYMHHYSDTPATYGEAGPLRGPGNRAIGHGALAERALEPLLLERFDRELSEQHTVLSHAEQIIAGVFPKLRERFERMQQKLFRSFDRVSFVITQSRNSLGAFEERLDGGFGRMMETAEQSLLRLEEKLREYDPNRALALGYSLVRLRQHCLWWLLLSVSVQS